MAPASHLQLGHNAMLQARLLSPSHANKLTIQAESTKGVSDLLSTWLCTVVYLNPSCVQILKYMC